MRVLSVREISCTAKAVFVTRASDEDRRSRRRGDDWRRSPSQSNLREAKGTALRPSSHGVAAPSRAAFAARQMRRAFVVRADRRNALMKRQFHLPNAPNMRISQCFQGCALHSHPKTGDISARLSWRFPNFTLGCRTFATLCAVLGRLRRLMFSRGALRLLRSSRFALTRPDAFGAGAFPLRRFAPYNGYTCVG